MIWREGFVYERFTLTKPIVEGGLERIGDLIIGLPQGQFPAVRAIQSRCAAGTGAPNRHSG
jgi:hypothetical protein